MTLQEKIIELLPKKIDMFFGMRLGKGELGFNGAIDEVHKKLPEILKLIREEVVQEILIECQKDIDFGAQHQQIVSTKGQLKCLVFLELLK